VQRNTLRKKLKAGKTTYGMWVTVESPNVTESAVALGLDWIVIEMEHGHLDWRNVMEHVRVTTGTDTAAVIRVPEVQRSNIQRALDIAADGVILPMVGDVEMLETAFQFGRFPPRGVRGVGGERSVQWGLQWEEYLKNADTETLIIPLLETRDAVENIESILSVDGLETVFFGPADMSASYGYLGEWEGPGVAEAILDVRVRAEQKGITAGILGRNTAEVQQRRDQGFQMIGLGADVNLMIRSLQETLNSL
jgi:2-keto-3-deoxy-L-rhamnonate aldolase RhmA